MTLPATAAEIYARSQGYECKGPDRCHWCGSPAERTWLHNDPPPTPFIRTKSTARVPHSAYECIGCWLWHRQRVTVFFLDGTLRDSQCAMRHSWLLTEQSANAINRSNYSLLYDTLLNPPRRFCLSLLDGENYVNRLELIQANDNMEVSADTVLHFTINHIPHSYSVYELEHALRHEPGGKSPGTQALIRLLGDYKLPEKKRAAGSPKKEDMENNPKATLKRTVRASGM